MDKNFKKPTIRQVTMVAKSLFFTIESVDLEFSNGVERIYERMQPSNHEGVLIIPIVDNHLLLIREYVVGIEDYELGFPKGLINVNEDIIGAANRELMEEAGFGACTFTFLNRLTIIPSHFSHRMNIIIAQELYPKKLKGDEPEPLSIVRWPISHMLDLLNEPDFCEARNVSALFLAYIWLNIR